MSSYSSVKCLQYVYLLYLHNAKDCVHFEKHNTATLHIFVKQFQMTYFHHFTVHFDIYSLYYKQLMHLYVLLNDVDILKH